MSSHFIKRMQPASSCVALLTSLLLVSTTSAHGGAHESHKQSSASVSTPAKRSNDVRPSGDLKLDPHELQPLSGGQVTATKWHFFEVVYTPQETRIYLYSPSHRPLRANGLRGVVVMQVNGNPQRFRYPVTPATDAQGRVYGSAVVDVSRVRDGDMHVTFELERLPFNQEKSAQFTQTFYLTRPGATVKVLELTEADRALVQRQRTCPVMGAGLGEHGQPIKLMVGNQTLFVCCEGCIQEVQKNPRQYLQKAVAPVPVDRQPPRPQVAVFWATRDDDAAIRAQGFCPVMDQPLGGHGRPIKVVIDGRPIFVCCQGCIDKAVQNRDLYFRTLANAQTARQSVPPPNQQAPPRRHIAVSYATEADRPAVQSQGVCPVMNQPLGEHGTPIKITIDGQPVFVCCQGCVGKVEQKPELYLSKVVRGQQPEHYSTQDDWFYQKPKANVSGASGSCCSGKSKGSSCH